MSKSKNHTAYVALQYSPAVKLILSVLPIQPQPVEEGFVAGKDGDFADWKLTGHLLLFSLTL